MIYPSIQGILNNGSKAKNVGFLINQTSEHLLAETSQKCQRQVNSIESADILCINPSNPSIQIQRFRFIRIKSKPYYSRWKDTAFVQGYKVLQYRIRWTKSAYSEEDAANGQYFHVPSDQLREFPGFVYHCHILPHEDNEMMRPIMLQLPKNAQSGTEW